MIPSWFIDILWKRREYYVLYKLSEYVVFDEMKWERMVGKARVSSNVPAETGSAEEEFSAAFIPLQ